MLSFHLALSKPQRRKLTHELQMAQNGGDLFLTIRLLIILAIADGMTTEKASKVFNFSDRSIRQIVCKYIIKGIRCLYRKRSSGRPPKLTKKQRKELSDIIDIGPGRAGFVGNCWRSQMVQVLIYDKFGVYYSVKYIPQLLKNIGFSFQKARFVSSHLDEKKRKEWMETTFPKILAEAKRKDAYLLFGDEASFPQWGTLNYTWARKGTQPTVKTCGKRKGYKVFGLIDYFTGKFFFKCKEGALNSEYYSKFLKEVLLKTRKHVILIQDGARYHTCKAMKAFFEEHKERITVYQLPSYSPDYNPIEKLWKKIKEKGTHLHYFPTFESLVEKVHTALIQFENAPSEVLSLFVMYNKLSSKQ